MFKNSLLAFTLLAAAAGAARADEPEAGTAMPPPAATAAAGPSGDNMFDKGTLGISVPLVGVLQGLDAAVSAHSVGLTTLDVLYFLDPSSAIDVIAGFDLNHASVPATMTAPATTTTTFGFEVGAGYRLYKHKGKFYAYVEPRVALAWPDTSASTNLDVLVGGDFGVERFISDWFSFSGSIGGNLNFTNSFKNIDLSTVTGIAANFYWQ